MRVSIFRRSHFNAAHRLYVKSWTDEQNAEKFGKCANPYFHGHNYELEVKVTGEVDPITGMVIDLKFLNDIIEENVSNYFDHRNLNEEIPEFKELIPSAENIAIVAYRLIKAKLADELELKVRLYETPRNYVEYPAE